MACSIRSPQDVCQNFEWTADGDYTAWTMYKINDTVCVNKAAASSGDECVMYYEIPKVVVPCITITSGNQSSFDEGSKVYFDSTASKVTNVASGNTLCGIVTTKPAVGATTVEIHLMGALGITS